MHLEIAPYLFLGSFIVVCVFNFIQCNICKIEDVKDYSKPSKILFWSLLIIMIYSLLATVTGLLNQQFFPNVSETTESVHTIYDNKDNAKVVYQNLDYTYEGGAESKANLRFVLAGLTSHSNKLIVTKGTESISKVIDEDEIVGDKGGIVTKIEYGTRKHTYRPLGLPVLTTEKSFVKVHLKPKNPQDRKAIENLLEGKKLNRKGGTNMYQFLFTGDNFIVSFIIGLLVLIGGYMLYDIAKKRIKPYIPLSVFIIVFGYGLSGWGLVGIPDMIKANGSSVTEQYDVSKDGNIIQFKRKTNNRALEKKVAVKVIGESKDAYQAEHHGDYYQISKTDVKKGN